MRQRVFVRAHGLHQRARPLCVSLARVNEQFKASLMEAARRNDKEDVSARV